jgi:hypothetical protein
MPGTPGVPSQSWYANANLPTELMQWNPFGALYPDYFVSEAVLTYTGDWDPDATYWQAAYWFKTHFQHPQFHFMYELTGIGLVPNAYIDPTPVPRILSAQVAGPGAICQLQWGTLGGTVSLIGEDNAFNGLMLLYQRENHLTVEISSQHYLDFGLRTVGGALVVWTSIGGGSVNGLAQFPIISLS